MAASCSKRPVFFTNDLFPTYIFLPSRVAEIPAPTVLLKFSAVSVSKPVSLAYLTMASPRRCSEPDSQAAARRISSSLSISDTISETSGEPFVRVPVLSKTTVSALQACSRAAPLRKRIPCSAAFPVPVIMATGVASPNAHGQEITRTEMNIDKTKGKSLPAKNHTKAEMRAILITVGTKYPATMSARRAIGAFEACASDTVFTI